MTERDEKFEAELAEARRLQEANRTLRERVRDEPKLQARVRQDLIADLLRVKEHPENRSIVTPVSRRMYRELGHFPEILVSDFFGNHAEYLRAAGLEDKRNTKTCRDKAARLHTEQSIARFAKENVLRFHGKWIQPKAARGHVEGLVCSDIHSMHCDPFARYCFMRSIELVQPDIVVVNGDLVDFPAVGSHPKLPGHFHLNLQQEIDWAKGFFREIRELAPSATIYFILGNHEFRLVRYLADTAPALASLESLSFDKLFGLADYQVSLVCRSNFLAPSQKARKADLSENWVVIAGCYAVTHGLSLSKNAAMMELQRFMLCGTSGHTHRPQLYYHNTLGTGGLHWMSTPMLCHESVGRDYVGGPTMWNCGFGQFSILPAKRLVSQQIVQVHEDWCAFAGATWTPTAEVYDARRRMLEVAA